MNLNIKRLLITLLIINLLVRLVVLFKHMIRIINCIEYFQISCKFIHDLIILV